MKLKKDVLLMFSGGKDSVACVIELLSKGYKVHLINFDNGCSQSLGYEKELAKSLECVFGKDNVEWRGTFSTIGSLMYYSSYSATIPFSEFIEKYGDFSQSQLQCLNCRSAMYEIAIAFALENGIPYLAEGARAHQIFAIEQEPMRLQYQKLCEEEGLKLFWPVWNYTDDDVGNCHKKLGLFIENNLPANTFLPIKENHICGEAVCIIGQPAYSDDITPEELQALKSVQDNTAVLYYEEMIKPKISGRILERRKIPFMPKFTGGSIQLD